VLKHHYPAVPNYGDMIKYEEWPDEPINLLVGGTPCQSFSVAGLRKGLADPRGNLMLTYGAIAKRYRPEWLVWENVPGVLSSNGGRDFGTFLGMLAELGYGFAYRVLDAQYFGVAQRRRRVFVVGHLGNWQRAAAVLFERHSLQGHPAPSRETRQDATTYTSSSIAEYRADNVGGTIRANGGDLGGGSETFVAKTLTAGIGRRNDFESDTFAVEPMAWDSEMNPSVNVAGTLLRGGQGGRQDGVCQPIPYDFFQITAPVNRQSREPGDPCHTLARDNAAHATIVQPTASAETAGTLRANAGSGFRSNGTPVEGVAIQAMQVRRLTPVECERLQGFPDGYTNIPWRNKTESPDGPRYKAMGNSMAVPVMRWIGERIAAVEAL
jgi:DNA (cytosine-5)-methyltransferase 1